MPADKQNKLKEDTASASALARDDWTPELPPELRRRAAVANEEHEHAMARKREEHAAQQQATLEKETAVEELWLQKLRLREEAARLERSRAMDT